MYDMLYFFQLSGSAGIGPISPEARPAQRVTLALSASRKAAAWAASKRSPRPAFSMAAENTELLVRAAWMSAGGVHPACTASRETEERSAWLSSQRWCADAPVSDAVEARPSLCPKVMWTETCGPAALSWADSSVTERLAMQAAQAAPFTSTLVGSCHHS